MPPGQALWVVHQACLGLAEAHARAEAGAELHHLLVFRARRRVIAREEGRARLLEERIRPRLFGRVSRARARRDEDDPERDG